MLDFKPTTPFFLGAMIAAGSTGSNGTVSATHSISPHAALPVQDDFGGLEIEIEPDLESVAGPQETHGGQDLFPHIDLPEGFTLSLGDDEKGDDFDLIIGPEFEQALAQELNGGDVEGLGEPTDLKDDLADLRLDEPLLDAALPDSLGVDAGSERELAIPDVDLNIALDIGSPGETTTAVIPDTPPLQSVTADLDEGGLTIDFSQNDLNTLLLELEDKPPET